MKKQTFFVWLSVALSTAAATWSLATAQPSFDYLTPEARALDKVLFAKGPNDSTNDPAWRVSLAVALRRYCESVLVQVPRNTPQEDRWVDDEYKELGLMSPDAGGYNKRLSRVANSPEHARKLLRHVLSECSSIANKLEGPKTKSLAADALLWVQLSRLFSVEESIWGYAEIVGLGELQKGCRRLAELIDDIVVRGILDAPSPDIRDPNNLCHWRTVQFVILDHAVIPLLEAAQ